MSFTVVGARGFIGRHLLDTLTAQGDPVVGLDRQSLAGDDAELFDRPLGHVIYCVGLTADFRQRPFDVVDSHVVVLQRLLQHARFDSLTYLSSTRLYTSSHSTDERAALVVRPNDPNDLYNLSKLMGESLCLNSGRPARVARLSNVYGPDFRSCNFLTQVLVEAARRGTVTFRSAPTSEKDYVALDDVIGWLISIARRGTQQIYNLACGANVSNESIASELRRLGVGVDFAPDAPTWSFLEIDASKVHEEFFLPRGRLLADLPGLLRGFRSHLLCGGADAAANGNK